MNEDNFFQSNQITPDDDEIKILELNAEPYPDRRRVRVDFRLSGITKSLGASLTLTNNAGEQLAAANIVNFFIPHSEVTLHIPAAGAHPGEYQLTLNLYSLQEVESDLEPGKVGAIRSHSLGKKHLSFIVQ